MDARAEYMRSYAERVERASAEEAAVEAALDSAQTVREIADAVTLLADSTAISEERGHILADAALVAAVALLAGDDAQPLISAYDRVPKWYA